MLNDGGLCDDDSEEIRVQMNLLESRWEQLRASAMEEQTTVYERLMETQRAELLRLQNWLERLEASIARLATSAGSLESRLKETRLLSDEIQQEDANIEAIRQLDIVDDSSNDEGRLIRKDFWRR